MSNFVVITGASSGIGFDTASYLHKLGYKVIGISRNYPKEKYDFEYILCDITNQEMIDKTIKEIEKSTDTIDVLINCAGMGISGAIEHTSLEEVNSIFQVNVVGVFLLTQAAIPLLRKSKRAKIINIGSVAGELSIPFQAFYSMTKASIGMFSECLRMELKPFCIDVTTVLPGDTKTGFTKNRIQPKVIQDELYKDRIKRSIEKMEKDEENGKPASSVTKVIYKLMKRKSMPVSVTVGFEYKLFVFLKRILPKRFVNWLLYQMYAK
ncbi:MAG: SDR family oxidoreductase [Firmicutes bacterium]|nr:SDR family oxidoreductase [Bacillota bacterium]